MSPRQAPRLEAARVRGQERAAERSAASGRRSLHGQACRSAARLKVWPYCELWPYGGKLGVYAWYVVPYFTVVFGSCACVIPATDDAVLA